MALDERNHLPVVATVAEALKLTWTLRLPYVVLALLATLPVVAATEFGLFEGLDAFIKQAESGNSSEILGQFPVGAVCLALVIGFAALSGFGVFWYRYLLLGRAGALKFGFAQLSAMVWRFTGYGLMVMTVGLVVMTVATLLGCLLGSMVSSLLGQSGKPLSYLIQFAFVVVTYAWPLSFAARTALIFPAIALGRPYSLAEAWAASKDCAGGLVWALLLTGIPLLLLSAGVHAALSAALGVDLMAGSTVSKGAYWWVGLALSPISNLAVAVMLGVVAIAFRELASPAPTAELAGGARLAH